MLKIRIPATTANMGPGFDCIGMAFKQYNEATFEVMEGEPGGLVIESHNSFPVPMDKSNMIYEAFANFYKEVGIGEIPGIKITQRDEIPMARGLGSSAACIVAGLLAANEISGVGMSREELAFLSAKLEGHPDNTVPAILGGMIVGVLTDKRLEHVKICGEPLERLRFAVMIPDFPLATDKARGILPKEYPVKDSIFNTSRAALMVAAIMNGELGKLSVAMDDCIHQPYRAKIIPAMDEIFCEARSLGAVSVFLSGAGPTIIAVLDRKDDSDAFQKNMTGFLERLPEKWNLKYIEPDDHGAVVLRA